MAAELRTDRRRSMCSSGPSVRGFARGDPVPVTDGAGGRVAYREALRGAGHHEPGEQTDASLPRTWLTAEPRPTYRARTEWGPSVLSMECHGESESGGHAMTAWMGTESR
ncbi:hypothetical protein GCM10010331_17120 [Streptomyces xanthochromogenes]|nr:hypothetical protein GCM10010331_17120 [Streptomyces xanthochromogenes]